MSRKITITEALNELKLYDARITKAIQNSRFCGAAKKSSDKIGTFTKDDFKERSKASYQSVVDLIANRNAMKSAIVKSNAVTEVTIAGKTMTVAEAIERKNSIDYEGALLLELKKQYADATNIVDKENKKVDAQVDKLLETLIGKETQNKVDKASQEAIETPYREKNEFELIDEIGTYDKILKLENEIDSFRSAVDTQLSVSNALSVIELDF